MSDRVVAAANDYAALAEQRGITPTQLALSWAASRWWAGGMAGGRGGVPFQWGLAGGAGASALLPYVCGFQPAVSPRLLVWHGPDRPRVLSLNN
jgi:hypothetical protein